MTKGQYHTIMMWILFIATDHTKSDVFQLMLIISGIYHIVAATYYTFKENK